MSLTSWVVSYLVNSLWQIPLLLAAGWIASRILRRVGAAMEHRVWVAVLLLQGILPICSTLPHEWMRRFVALGGASRAGSGGFAVQIGPGSIWSGGGVPSWLFAGIAFLYGAALACFTARFAWRLWRLHILRAEAVGVDLSPAAALDWQRCVRRFQIDGVSFAMSFRISGPVTLGFWQKLVLFPVEMLSRLHEPELQAVIAHECAHIRRNDFLKNLLYELFSLPMNYHPLFWLTRERIMESREIVCDEMAAEIGGPKQYARSLLQLASLLVETMPVRTPQAIGIFDTKTFERRIMKLAEKKIEMKGTRRLITGIACAAFAVATCGSALALGMQVNVAAASSGSQGMNSSQQNNVSAGVMRIGDGVSAPALIYSVDPGYSIKARRAKYQGICVLAVIVNKDGKPQNIRVVHKLGMGLDEKAVEAVQQYRFKPAYYRGHPVPVQINIEVNFKIYR